jgi:hypothetical protein
MRVWQQQWNKRLAGCDHSGLSSKAFGKQQDLGQVLKRLYWSCDASPQAPIRVELGVGVVLSIALGVNEATFHTVVTVLGWDRRLCFESHDAGSSAHFLAAGLCPKSSLGLRSLYNIDNNVV